MTKLNKQTPNPQLRQTAVGRSVLSPIQFCNWFKNKNAISIFKTKNIGLLKPKRIQRKRPKCNEPWKLFFHHLRLVFEYQFRPVIVMHYLECYSEDQLMILFRQMSRLERQGFQVQLM